ncbi:hypothetical protein LSUE1_G003357 [Lachnellula suecica]|uniref:N-acetyltransferase domain-containing protein n=1 Tax=Lachnellula suecica TaxID=602035 RepID=A0A8T9CBU8_9HELO|nr:hypothetical protein LSUE1_G003357 [Lachnellula suecica]
MTSTSHPVSIQPRTESDIPEQAQMLLDSKLALTINRLLFKDWPNETAQRKNYTNAIEAASKNPAIETLKVIDDETHSMVGYLVLTRQTPPEVKADPGTGDKKREVPESMNEEVFHAVMEAAGEVGMAKDIDHFELTHIYIKTSHRRQGIGSQLIRMAVVKAQNAEVPLAACSEPQVHEFLLKHGFKDTKHVDVDLGKWAPEFSGFGIFRISGMVISV